MSEVHAAPEAFEAGFMAALRGEPAPPGPAPAWAVHPALAVYRNTVLQGCVAALAANFPTVVRLTGRAWFDPVALDFARDHPPDDPRLLRYGEGFPDRLADLAPVHGLPYLAGVASLDRLWMASHTAADAVALTAARLAPLSPEALGAQVLQVHPACRWAWFDGLPVATLWQCSRAARAVPEDLAWRGEGLLMVRPRDAVHSHLIGRGGGRFLAACAAGRTLAEAAQQALAGEPGLEVGALLHLLLTAGAFTCGDSLHD